MSWEPLRGFEMYEIYNEYPYNVRKCSTQDMIKESYNNCNYIQINLNGRCYTKHYIIANQWIPNPDNLRDVNHIDKNRSNNHINNLEWCSHSDNLKDRSSWKKKEIENIDSLPPNAYHIEEYNGFTYNRYWFDKENMKLIIYTKGKYRIVNPSGYGNNKLITLTDSNGLHHTVSYKKFVNSVMNSLDI